MGLYSLCQKKSTFHGQQKQNKQKGKVDCSAVIPVGILSSPYCLLCQVTICYYYAGTVQGLWKSWVKIMKVVYSLRLLLCYPFLFRFASWLLDHVFKVLLPVTKLKSLCPFFKDNQDQVRISKFKRFDKSTWDLWDSWDRINCYNAT